MRSSEAEGAGRAFEEREIRFDAESGELAGPLGSTRLAPQPALLLDLLRRHAGMVVDRERIKDHLWPGGRVEFDQGIAFAVREIRKGLEAVGADPLLVETLPRRGLRLRPPETPASGRTAGRLRRGVAGGVVVLAVVLTTALMWSTRTPGALPVVAILEYETGDGRPQPEPGLGQMLTTALTNGLGGMAGVIGPSGTGALAGPEDTEGARTGLGACLLLSGSLRLTDTDTLVVFTQIVQTSDRVHAWARWDTLAATEAGNGFSGPILEATRGALAAC